MDNRSKKRRAVELVKDLLIVALTCSALWLVFHSQRLVPQREDMTDTGGQTQGGQLDGESRPRRPVPCASQPAFPAGRSCCGTACSMTRSPVIPCSSRWPTC